MTAPGSAGGAAGGAEAVGAAASAAGSADDDRRTFEDLMAELEEVTARLAAGDIGIEAAADLYERAEQLHARASARLDQVRERVQRLSESRLEKPL